MWFWSKMLTSLVSVSMLAWTSECSSNTKNNISDMNLEAVDTLEEINSDTTEIPNLLEIQKWLNKEISVCLTTDDENSFTYKKALESISNPENTTLEFPVSPLFKKYWNRSHPLAVRWIKKDFRALLWKDWIEDLSAEIPQKLSHRAEKVTSDTQYEVWDTIRFQLINPSLKWVFPKYLSDQLKEDWFQTFSDPDSVEVKKRIENKNQNIKKWNDKKSDFIYDIVVKKLPTWEWVLALYRDWELFMATYVSIWLPVVWTKYWKRSAKTKRWQFKIIKEDPYYYSRKYKSPMPCWVNFDEWWFWFHQWNVTRRPASHGCVRQPWIRSLMLFSSVKDANRWDVFISNNLYK